MGDELGDGVHSGLEQIVELLLDRGADPMARDAHGRTPFDIARRHARAEVADLLRARGAHAEPSERDLFLEACARADEVAARAILAAKPDLVARLTDLDREVFTDAAWQWAIAGREKTKEHNPGGDYAGVIDALVRAGAQNAVPSGS